MHFRLPLILLASMLEKIVSISLVNTLSFGVPQRMVASRIPSSYLYKI